MSIKMNKEIKIAFKRQIWLVLFACALALPAHADTVFGLYLDIDGWQVQSSGDIGTAKNDMQNFELDDETKVSFSLSLEHPIPIIPNVRLRTVDLSGSGDTTLDSDFSFGGVNFASGDVVATEFDLQSTDITLYYEIFDNDVVSFDLGLAGKYLDGEYTVEGQTGSGTARSSEAFKGVVPLLYGALMVGVPNTGLSFFGEISAIEVDNNSIQDYQAGVAYSFMDNMALDVSVRAGYREFNLELDDVDNIFTDWSFNGPFLGVQAHF